MNLYLLLNVFLDEMPLFVEKDNPIFADYKKNVYGIVQILEIY